MLAHLLLAQLIIVLSLWIWQCGLWSTYAPAALHVHILVLVHVYGLITRNSMLLLVYHCNYLGLIDVIVPVI